MFEQPSGPVGSGGFRPEDVLSMAASSSLPQQGQTPSNMTTMGPAPLQPPTPMPRLQMPQATYPKAGNEFQTVGGRKRADKQALFSTIANMVKAGGDYVQAKKNRTLQTSIERLMEAQQGLQEAQEIAKQNPNDPKAQEAVAHNTAIINDITADPKINKQLQKAFNISLFGDGKNKNENKALIDAWGNFQKKQKEGDKTALNPIAQRLMQQQPMRQQIDPQAAIQAQMIKSGLLPAAKDLLKADIDNKRILAQAKTAGERTAAIKEHDRILEENAKLIAGAKDKQTSAYLARTTLMGQNEKDRFKVLNRVADLRYSETVLRVDAMKQIASGKDDVQMARIKSLEKIAGDKNKTQQERFKAQNDLNRLKMGQTILGGMAKQLTSYNTTYKTLKDENVKLHAEIDKKGSSIFGFKMSAADNASQQQMRETITRNLAMMNTIDGQMKEINNRMGQMQQAGLLGVTQLDNNQDPENMFPPTSENSDDSNSDSGGDD